MDGFTLNGFRSDTDLGIVMEKVVKPIAPSMSPVSEDVPTKYGVNYEGTNYQAKAITISYTVMNYESQNDFNRAIQNLAAKLIRPELGSQEYALVFDDEPDKTYMGHVSAIDAPNFISVGAYDFSGNITFEMSDPRAYLPLVTIPIDNSNNMADVTVDGTAPSDPVISIIPKRDLNHAGFVLNGGNFGVGTDDDVQQPNVQSPYTSIVEDNAGSISEWSNDTSAISSITTASDFVAQSSMVASTDGSSVLNVARNKDNTFNFGSFQQSKWYGPLYRYQGISASLPYYKISAMLHHKIYDGIHNLRAMGDIEFLLLDGNGQSFGRFAIKSQSGGHVPYALMQIGTAGSSFSTDSDHHTLYNGKGVNFTDKKNIKVRLQNTIKTGKRKRIKYINVVNAENTSALTDAWLEFTLEHTLNNGVPVFNWSIIQYNLKTGLPYKYKRKHLIVSGQFVDNSNKFSSSLGSVGLGMWKMSITEDTTNPAIPYRNCYMSLTELSIYQVNQQQLEPTKPKQVAKAGQELILDCANDRATVDGHEISPTWTTTFPKFKPGFNEIVLAGDITDADIVLSYYPRTY